MGFLCWQDLSVSTGNFRRCQLLLSPTYFLGRKNRRRKSSRTPAASHYRQRTKEFITAFSGLKFGTAETFYWGRWRGRCRCRSVSETPPAHIWKEKRIPPAVPGGGEISASWNKHLHQPVTTQHCEGMKIHIIQIQKCTGGGGGDPRLPSGCALNPRQCKQICREQRLSAW